MRAADHIADWLARHTDHVFMVVGGGAMYLDDAVAKHPDLTCVYHHHEQAAAMAAISYAKHTTKLGVCLVTTGCGGTNTMTPLLHAWQDGVPCLFLAGQASINETMSNNGHEWRQEGTQEADVAGLVGPITKYAVTIDRPELVDHYLDRALHKAHCGRCGPAWVDVPLNIQGASLTDVAVLLRRSNRPVVLAGNGVRAAGAAGLLKTFVEEAQIPLVTTFLGADLVASDHPCVIGRVGVKGTRAGNFAVQNADLVLALGTRLSVNSVGHRREWFARDAIVVSVDVEPWQKPGVTHHIVCDVKHFLRHLGGRGENTNGWLAKCRRWRDMWPVCGAECRRDGLVNLYHFLEVLCQASSTDHTIVSDAGSAFFVTSQAAQFKQGQRYITSGAQAEMGYVLPACIGVAFAGGLPLGITGDGSLQMNIQELQTVKHHGLPIKLFVLNNGGYLSIKRTQNRYCGGRHAGVDADSGVSFPELENIAKAYGVDYIRIKSNSGAASAITTILATDGPVVCEVMCDPDQEIAPAVTAEQTPDGLVPKPLEDMYPFLDRQVFKKEMIVKPL